MKLKRWMSLVLAIVVAFSLLPDIPMVANAAPQQEEEEEAFLGSTGAVLAQYSLGTTSITFLEVTVSETAATNYGVVINGIRYAKTGNAFNGKFMVQLSKLQANTSYTAYPYADDLVSENGITFTTAVETTTNGNLSSYYSLTPGQISYCIKNSTAGTIDIQGASQIKTTYSNAGWSMTNGNSNVQAYAVPTIVTGVSGKQYVRLTYVVRNNTAATISGYRFGINCDSMIGTNDAAPVYTTSYGMRVAASTAEDALAFAVITKTSNAADGLGRMVNDVTTQWYGNYSARVSNQFNVGSSATLTNIDSGMALSWQNVTLSAGEAKTFSVIFGVADSATLSKVYEQLEIPTVTDKKYNSITVNTIADQTYYIETTAGALAQYVATENGSHTFEGLMGGTTYQIYTNKTSQTGGTTYIASNNAVVTTLPTPAIKTKIENIASFKTVIGDQTNLVTLLGQKIEGLAGAVTITSAELVNPSDSRYVTLDNNGAVLTGRELTPDGYKVPIKITTMHVNYSDTWGHGLVLNDVLLRVRVTVSEKPYLTKQGCEITLNSTDYHGIKTVKYTYTGDQKVEYSGWFDFYTYGKSTPVLKAVNGANGYKSKTGTVTQKGVDEEGEALYESTLHRTTVDLPEIGYYTFLITDQSGQQFIQYVNIDAADWAVNKPRLYKENNLVTYVNNNSGLYQVNYMHTGDTEYNYTSWAAFVTKGKEDTQVNTTSGYRAVKGTNTGNTESTLNESNTRITLPGWYTFVMVFKGGKMVSYNVHITPEEAETNLPKLVSQENSSGAVVYNNNSNLTKVTYQYSSPTEEYTYGKWERFVTNGKRYTDVNGASGYKTVSGTVTDGVSTLDGKAFNLVKAGWYTFLLFYNMDGKEKILAKNVYIANDFSDIAVNSTDFSIGYRDTLVAGGFYEYSYQFMGAQEPEINTDTYAPDKTQKINVLRTEIGGAFNFTVSRAGWYVLKVKDTALGTKYYKVKVVEPTPITDQTGQTGFPYLSIETVNITAMDTDNDILFIRLGSEGEFTPGGVIRVEDTGQYTVQVIDDRGKLYALTAVVSTLSNKEYVDTDALSAGINDAKNFYDNSGYLLVDDVNGQTEAGTYISRASHETFRLAIQAAEDAKTARVSQTAVNNALKNLKAALTAYRAASKIVQTQLVTVDGSTVRVAPIGEADRLTTVYHVAQGGAILPAALGSWSQMLLFERVKTTSFDETGAMVLQNVPNGIYTFLITINEAGTVKTEFHYGIVANESTVVAVGKEQLNGIYANMGELLNTVKKESEAVEGDSYVSDTIYRKLQTAYDKANTMLLAENTTDAEIRDVYIPFMIDWVSIKVSVQNNTAQKEPDSGGGSTEPEEPEAMQPVASNITLADDSKSSNINFASPDVSSMYVAFGNCTSWNAMVAAGYTKLTPKNGTAVFNTLINGTYTALVNYRNGSSEYINIIVEGIVYPFTVTDVDGKINVTFEDLNTVSCVAYGYGDNYQAYNSPGLLSYDVTNWDSAKTDTNTLSFTATGNGTHTVFVKSATGLVYKVLLEVQSCTKPSIIHYDGKFAVFANGFNIKSVAYALGEFSSWDAMYANAYYMAVNSWIDKSSMAVGNYTFCFTTYDGTQFFETIAIP